MSQITSNPTSARQGIGENPGFNREMFEQLHMAFIQIGLKGPQQINEGALQNVLTTKADRGE